MTNAVSKPILFGFDRRKRMWPSFDGLVALVLPRHPSQTLNVDLAVSTAMRSYVSVHLGALRGREPARVVEQFFTHPDLAR